MSTSCRCCPHRGGRHIEAEPQATGRLVDQQEHTVTDFTQNVVARDVEAIIGDVVSDLAEKDGFVVDPRAALPLGADRLVDDDDWKIQFSDDGAVDDDDEIGLSVDIAGCEMPPEPVIPSVDGGDVISRRIVRRRAPGPRTG